MAPGEAVANVNARNIGNPVIESSLRRTVVGINTAALEKIDHHLVDQVDVDAGFEGMRSRDLGYHVGELQAMFVRFGGSRERVRHTVAQHVRATGASADANGRRPKVRAG